jgi:tRNA(Ser,Leu) C12 N-acetylase TAN1
VEDLYEKLKKKTFAVRIKKRNRKKMKEKREGTLSSPDAKHGTHK